MISDVIILRQQIKSLREARGSAIKDANVANHDGKACKTVGTYSITSSTYGLGIIHRFRGGWGGGDRVELGQGHRQDHMSPLPKTDLPNITSDFERMRTGYVRHWVSCLSVDGHARSLRYPLSRSLKLAIHSPF
jgi:hypothetical protein